MSRVQIWRTKTQNPMLVNQSPKALCKQRIELLALLAVALSCCLSYIVTREVLKNCVRRCVLYEGECVVSQTNGPPLHSQHTTHQH